MYLYSAKTNLNQKAFPLKLRQQEILEQTAVELDLDSADLSQVLAAGTFVTEVLADQDEAKQAGVHAVPAFAMNGRVVASGVQTANALRNLHRMPPL